MRGQSGAIEALLDHGVHMNTRDTYGRTALMHAIENSHQESVDALVVRGAELPRSGYRVSKEVMLKRRALEGKN